MSSRIPDRTTRPRSVARVLLGGVLAFAGISHLTFAREEFTAQVPDWTPGTEDQVVLASGVAEIALGSALVLAGRGRRRRAVGLIAAAFFVAIFPGNVSQWLNGVDGFGLDTDGKRLARLFGQPLLIAWALWATGAPRRLRTARAARVR